MNYATVPYANRRVTNIPGFNVAVPSAQPNRMGRDGRLTPMRTFGDYSRNHLTNVLREAGITISTAWIWVLEPYSGEVLLARTLNGGPLRFYFEDYDQKRILLTGTSRNPIFPSASWVPGPNGGYYLNASIPLHKKLVARTVLRERNGEYDLGEGSHRRLGVIVDLGPMDGTLIGFFFGLLKRIRRQGTIIFRTRPQGGGFVNRTIQVTYRLTSNGLGVIRRGSFIFQGTREDERWRIGSPQSLKKRAFELAARFVKHVSDVSAQLDPEGPPVEWYKGEELWEMQDTVTTNLRITNIVAQSRWMAPRGANTADMIDSFFHKLYLAAPPSLRVRVEALKNQQITYEPITTSTYCFTKSLVIGAMITASVYFKNKKKGITRTHYIRLYDKMRAYLAGVSGLSPEYTEEKQPIYLAHYTKVIKKVLFTQKTIDFRKKKLMIYFFNTTEKDTPTLFIRSYSGPNAADRPKLVDIVRIAVLNSTHVVPLLVRTSEWGEATFQSRRWFSPHLTTSMVIPQNDYGKKEQFRGKVRRNSGTLGPLTEGESRITKKYRTAPNIIYWDTETRNDRDRYRAKLNREYSSLTDKARKKRVDNILAGLKDKIGTVGVPLVYMIQGLWIDPGTDEDIIFWELDDVEPPTQTNNCIARFFTQMYEKGMLAQDGESLGGNVLLAHNAGRFDNYFLLSWLVSTLVKDSLPQSYPFVFYIKTIIQRNGVQYINFTMKHKATRTKYTFHARDTLRFMPLSLKAVGKLFGLDQQKDVLPYESISTIEDVAKYREQIISYGKLDVIVLKNAYEFMIKAFKKISDNINIANISSTTRFIRTLIYSEKFYPDPAQSPRFTPSEIDKNTVSPYYFGGRTEPFKKGYFQCFDRKTNLSYWDFTSFYPFIMSNFEMPEGKYRRIEAPETDRFFLDLDFKFDNNTLIRVIDRIDPFFLEIGFSHRDTGYPPLFPFKSDDGTLLFSHFVTSPGRYMVYSEELKIILQNEDRYGMDFSFGSFAFVFPFTTADYKKFIDRMFQEKADVDVKLAEKDVSKEQRAWFQAYRTVMKLLINGAYGFKAEKSAVKKYEVVEDKEGHMEEMYKGLVNATVTNFDDQDTVKMFSYDALAYTKERNIFQGIFVTNLARLYLYKLFVDGITAGFELVYCDTDSAIFMGGDYEDFQRKVVDKSPLYSGGKITLGGLTRESPPIVEMVVIAAKIYAYRCPKDDGTFYDVIKFKGFNQATSFSKKEFCADPDTGNQFLKLSDAYSEAWFDETGNTPYHIEFSDMVKWAKGEIKYVQVGLERFHFGMSRLDPDGFGRESIVISYTGRNTKSLPGRSYDYYTDLMPIKF